jgi:hypothetical protein
MSRETVRSYKRAFSRAGILEGAAEDLPEMEEIFAVLAVSARGM